MSEPAGWSRLFTLSVVHHALGHTADSDAALRELKDNHGNFSACQIAYVHAARGEIDAAFEWLDRAYAQRDGGIASSMRFPAWRHLHDDPRWSAFLRKLGLER